MAPTWLNAFLVGLERTGNVSGSARTAGVSPTTAYNLRRDDADVAAAWAEAMEAHVDRCEEEATRRAFGFEEPVVYQGQLTPVYERDERGQVVLETVDVQGEPRMVPVQARNPDGSLKWLSVTKHSDALLLAKLKAHRPIYATTRTEVTGRDGGAMQIDATARRARIASIYAAAKAREGLA